MMDLWPSQAINTFPLGHRVQCVSECAGLSGGKMGFQFQSTGFVCLRQCVCVCVCFQQGGKYTDSDELCQEGDGHFKSCN